MNEYCRHLNIPFEPFSRSLLSKLVSERKIRTVVKPESITPELINFFNLLGLKVNSAFCFYKPGELSNPEPTPTHTDCPEVGDIVNINWVYFQSEESTMNWYKFKQDPVFRVVNPPGTKYNVSYIDSNELDLVYKEKIGFPSMVQAGVPHNISVGPYDRLCVCMYVVHQSTNKMLTWQEAIEKYRNYLK